MANAVCGFGHRNIFEHIESADEIIKFKQTLSIIIEQLITDNDYKIFLTGRRGEFDNIFAQTIRSLKNRFPHIKLILVEPYFSNTLNVYKDYFDSMYDSIIIPEELSNADYKQAIPLRNRWMVEQSDIVISYVNRYSGGAYKAIKYAKELGVFVLNLGTV